mgnify:CR=1 FL=1
MRFAPVESLGRDALVVELMRPLARYLGLPGATEVVINVPGLVFVEVGPEWQRFEDESLTMSRLMSLARAIATFTEQDIGPQHPILSATLPGGQRVQVHYSGWLNVNGKRGKLFDSSRKKNKPFIFALGEGQVIRGWDEGVAGMKRGEKRILYVPAMLGYGSRGAGDVIPPDSNLIFEVELLDFE